MVTEPVVPAAFEILTWGLGVIWFIAFILAIVTLAKTKDLKPGIRLLWIIVILALPVAGPVSWFVYRAYRKNQ